MAGLTPPVLCDLVFIGLGSVFIAQRVRVRRTTGARPAFFRDVSNEPLLLSFRQALLSGY